MATSTMIPNKPFRERYLDLVEKEGLTLGEVAYRAGWVSKRRGKEKPDSSRVARTLGIVEEDGRRRENLSYEIAVLLARALHMDLTELGI